MRLIRILIWLNVKYNLNFSCHDRFEQTHNLNFDVVSIYLSEIALCITWKIFNYFFFNRFKHRNINIQSIILNQDIIRCIFDIKTYFILLQQCDISVFHFIENFSKFLYHSKFDNNRSNSSQYAFDLNFKSIKHAI